MEVVQSEGEGSDVQETSEQILTHVPQQPNDHLRHVNMIEGMSQEGPTAANSIDTFASVASHVPELLSNESLTLPQLPVPHQIEPTPVQIPALGVPQDLYSNGFQENISFTNPPNIATSHSTFGALVFYLQAIARTIGFILVPDPMPGAGT